MIVVEDIFEIDDEIMVTISSIYVNVIDKRSIYLKDYLKEFKTKLEMAEKILELFENQFLSDKVKEKIIEIGRKVLAKNEKEKEFYKSKVNDIMEKL